MGDRLGLVSLLVTAGCATMVTAQQRAEEAGKAGNWGKSMAAYDWEYEQGSASKRREIADARDRAATNWIRGELDKARAALAAGRPDEAFGITSTLTREAQKRKLAALDDDEIQPVATQAVLALIPKQMAQPLATSNAPAARAAGRALISILHGKGAAEARAAAALLMKDHTARERLLAADALGQGRVAAAYLHGALVDDYTFKVRTQSEQSALDDKIDNMARFFWMMNGAPSCEALAKGTAKYTDEHKTFGAFAAIKFTVAKCSLEPERWTTQEERSYKKYNPGQAVSTTTGGYYQRTEAVDQTGSYVPSKSKSEWVPGSTTNATTQDGYTDAKGIANVEHTRWRWEIDATIRLEATGEQPLEVPFRHTSSVEVEHWQIAGNQGDLQTSGGSDASVMANATAAVDTAVGSALDSAIRQKTAERSTRLAASAASASSPAQAEDFHIAAVRADAVAGAASAKVLAAQYSIPEADVLGLILNGATPDAASSLAFTLAVPPPLADPTAMQGTLDTNALGEARHRDLEKNIELAAALTSTSADKTPMGNADGTGAIGVGVALVYGASVDPGVGYGVIADIAMDFRLGYAGALFWEGSVPVALGYRFGSLGVTLLGSVGGDKYGALDGTDLYVNRAPYVAYGVGASLFTMGKFDVAASFQRLSRMERFAEMGEPRIGAEDRLEVRVLKYSLPHNVITLTGRYQLLDGDIQDGRILTFWLGISGRD